MKAGLLPITKKENKLKSIFNLNRVNKNQKYLFYSFQSSKRERNRLDGIRIEGCSRSQTFYKKVWILLDRKKQM